MCRRDRDLMLMPRHGILPCNDGTQLRPFEKPALPFDSRTRALTRAAIAILVVLLAAWVARDFLVALTWAIVIAVAVWPIYIAFATPIRGPAALAPLLFALL